jgi:hypothetical protein
MGFQKSITRGYFLGLLFKKNDVFIINSSVHHRVKHLSPKKVSNECETERVRSWVVG